MSDEISERAVGESPGGGGDPEAAVSQTGQRRNGKFNGHQGVAHATGDGAEALPEGRAAREPFPLRVVPACTHLGLEQDPFNHHDVPSSEHRCYLWMQRDRIDVAHQEMFCLTEQSARCPWLSISVPAKKAAAHQRVAQGAVEQISEKIDRVEGYYQRAVLDALLKFAVATARASAVTWRAAQPILLQLGLLLLAALRFSTPYLLWPLRWLSRHYSDLQRAALRVLWNATLGRVFRTKPKPLEQTDVWINTEASHSAVGAPEQASAAAQSYVQRGLEAMRDGDQAAALRRFRLATAADSSIEQAWMLRGALADTPEEKAECLRQVLAINPSNARARTGLVELGIASALPASPKDAPETQPWVCSDCKVTNLTTADVCSSCGRPSANLQLEVAVDGSFLNSGLAAMRAGNEELAYHYFSLGSETEPDNEQAWYWRAKTAPTVDVVIRCLRHLVAINPANAKAQADLAWALQRQQREQQTGERHAAQVLPAKAARPSRFGSALRAGLLQLASVCSFVLGLALALPYALRLTDIASSPDVGAYAGLLPSFNVPAWPVSFGLLPVFDLGAALPLVAGVLLLHAGFCLDGAGRGMRVWTAIIAVATIVLVVMFAADSGLTKPVVASIALIALATALFGRAEKPPLHEQASWSTL